MDENDIFMVGYGGWVRLKRHASGTPYNYQNPFAIAGEGTLVQATSASISRTKNIPQVMSYYLPFHDREGTARSQMLLGDGTYSFNGEVTFELTLGTLIEFVNEEFFERDTIFSMSFFDGQNVCSVTNCVWNNLQIQCHPGSLVTMSISYQSNNSYMDAIQVQPMAQDNGLIYDENDLLVPYWTCGREHFQEFGITFERPVTPVFLNGDLKVASYLRPGLVSVSLNATTIEYIDDWDERIRVELGAGEDIEEHAIILKKSILQSCQYNMSTMSDTGAKTYTWNSISEDAHERVFDILPNDRQESQ